MFNIKLNGLTVLSGGSHGSLSSINKEVYDCLYQAGNNVLYLSAGILDWRKRYGTDLANRLLGLTAISCSGESASSEISKELTSFVGGEVSLLSGNLIFLSELGETLLPVEYHTAGVLQLLSRKGLLTGGTYILEAPETFLTPMQQVNFAKTLVKVVLNGANLLVSSYSPYLVEALEVYGNLAKLESRMTFYYNSSEAAYPSCEADALESIFKEFADPFNILEGAKVSSIEW